MQENFNTSIAYTAETRPTDQSRVESSLAKTKKTVSSQMKKPPATADAGSSAVFGRKMRQMQLNQQKDARKLQTTQKTTAQNSFAHLKSVDQEIAAELNNATINISDLKRQAATIQCKQGQVKARMPQSPIAVLPQDLKQIRGAMPLQSPSNETRSRLESTN